jgi:hypothetical protein
MEKPAGQWIHFSELKPFATSGPGTEEYDTYRREVGRLIAEGHEGQYVLIHATDIVGFFESQEEAYSEGYRRYLLKNEVFFVHQVRTFEPVVRAG